MRQLAAQRALHERAADLRTFRAFLRQDGQLLRDCTATAPAAVNELRSLEAERRLPRLQTTPSPSAATPHQSHPPSDAGYRISRKPGHHTYAAAVTSFHVDTSSSAQHHTPLPGTATTSTISGAHAAPIRISLMDQESDRSALYTRPTVLRCSQTA